MKKTQQNPTPKPRSSFPQLPAARSRRKRSCQSQRSFGDDSRVDHQEWTDPNILGVNRMGFDPQNMVFDQ